MLWLRRNAVVVGAVLSTAALIAIAGLAMTGSVLSRVHVLSTAALIAIAGLAMTGSVLSRVHEIEGARGGTLTLVSLEGAPDLDPARVNDV